MRFRIFFTDILTRSSARRRSRLKCFLISISFALSFTLFLRCSAFLSARNVAVPVPFNISRFADQNSFPNRTLRALVWNSRNPSWSRTVCSNGFEDDGEVSAERRQTRRLCCEFTLDREMYNKSEAVIFYGDLMHLSSFPTRRDNGQKWVYLSNETPVNTIHTGIKQIRLKRQRHLYNITSTYSFSSDLPIPYHDGKCVIDDRKYRDSHNVIEHVTRSNVVNYHNGDISNEHNHQLTTAPDDELNRNNLFISRKTRLVAWFVSHCQTTSRREKYVRELQKYIHVDIYGQCGPLQCLRRFANLTGKLRSGNYSFNSSSLSSTSTYTSDYYSTCDDMVEDKYKFYLAFENSLCADYVTEKYAWLFFRFLRRDIIAIALGAADYTRFVPRHTYIDVRDFRSPHDLALRLKLLDTRDDLYAQYIARKRLIRCPPPQRVDTREKRMCRYLHKNYGRSQTADLSVLTDAIKVCTSAGEFFRHIADMIVH